MTQEQHDRMHKAMVAAEAQIISDFLLRFTSVKAFLDTDSRDLEAWAESLGYNLENAAGYYGVEVDTPLFDTAMDPNISVTMTDKSGNTWYEYSVRVFLRYLRSR